MSNEIVRVPDVGSSDPVDVIEVTVKTGDQLSAEDTIVVLESDKATVEVPAPKGGEVAKVLVATGDRVKEGDPLLELVAGESAESDDSAAEPDATQEPAGEPAQPQEGEQQAEPAGESAPAGAMREETVTVPDLGDIDSAEIIEVNVAAGDAIEAEQVVAVLESDKASLEIPSPKAGTVKEMKVSAGDKVGTGDPLLTLAVAEETGEERAPEAATGKEEKEPSQPEPAAPAAPGPAGDGAKPAPATGKPAKSVHAGPAVRKLARETGVDLAEVAPSGPRGRILKEDVHVHVKQRLQGQQPAAAGGAVTLPEIDFSQFGDIERVELNKLRKVSAQNLSRAWQTIPHVTQHEQADITELETFRKQQNRLLEKEGVKLTMLAFLVQACAKALQAFPKFNASLENSGEALIYKQYINIGIAVDTPNGLVVPVIKDADQKGLKAIAEELSELAAKARERKLSPADMKGGTFSISSLGGIGGTAFTPIVNWPEAAILGASRSDWQPVWDGTQFQPRLTLPLSLSYDHRVIDGADAARFTRYLSELLSDLRRALL